MSKYKINIFYDENASNFFDLIEEVLEYYIKEKLR